MQQKDEDLQLRKPEQEVLFAEKILLFQPVDVIQLAHRGAKMCHECGRAATVVGDVVDESELVDVL